MASIFTPTSFGAALGPYAIDINDCLGDSVGIINANTNYLASYTAAVSAATNLQLATTITTLSTVPHARLNDGGQTGIAPIFGARAWVTFNGTIVGSNAPQTILQQGNVTSVTRIGTNTGQYLITFSLPLPHTNYACVGGGKRVDDVGGNEASPQISFSNLTTTTVKMGCQDNDSNGDRDGEYLTAVFFG